ncbi:unnamed protein product [Haemonchus placei]|uniref:PRELI/MSF1 domain-containing protein n=1 Tax=Haemonchus placei TaxID=6290 RepID=A0A0N4X9N6_HAEPC|nr:unnamed protein product [Haemonchus placei]
MRFWSAPTGLFPYSFDEVVSVFWDRYPNSFAKHIVTEDVLERVITENTIVTKKLIVKHGEITIFYPHVDEMLMLPCLLTLQDHLKFLFLQVIEESIYDRRTRTLTTYTRNVSHNELFAMHERCVYRPTTVRCYLLYFQTIALFIDLERDSLSEPMTDIMRSVYISIHCGRMSSVYEKLMLLGYKKSVSFLMTRSQWRLSRNHCDYVRK